MTRTTTARFLGLLALLALTSTTALAAPGDCRLIRGATTPDTADDVSVCRQDTWLHQASTKVGNAAALGQGTYPSWNTTKPTASVQSGAGGGYLAAAVIGQNVSRTDGRGVPTFVGTFTGNLDNIAATLYLFSPARSVEATQAVWLRLKVDGEILYQTGAAADRTPLVPGGDAVLKTDFAFSNIYTAMESRGMDLTADRAHNVELIVSQWFTANDNAVYVYDTSEVPAGLVFNLEVNPLKAFTKFAATGA